MSDPAETNPPARSRPKWSRWLGFFVDGLGIAAAAVAIFYFSFLMLRQRIPHVTETDNRGYFLMAQAMSHFSWPRWADEPAQFYGHLWVDVGDGQVMAKYPPGWPLLMVPAFWVGGIDAALWVNPILAIVAAVAFFLLVTELFNTTAACICTALWLFSPMLPFYIEYPLSHGSDVAFGLLTFLFVVRAIKTGSPVFAGLAGACAGFLPLIRPANLLVWPAVVLLAIVIAREQRVLDWDRFRRKRWRCFPRRSWLVFAITFSLPLLFLAIFNWVSFGAPWRTGYALTSEQTAVVYDQLIPRLQQVFGGRGSLLENKYWWLVLLGLLLRTGRTGLLCVLLLWITPLLIYHMGYYFFFPSAVFFRFFMSAFPACILMVGFLLSGPILSHPLVRLGALLAFGAWFWASPPRMFDTMAQLRGGREYTFEETWRDEQLALTVWLMKRGHDDPPAQRARDIKELAGDQRVAVYDDGAAGWTAGLRQHGVSYDLDAWTNEHFYRPVQPKCDRGQVWGDQRRHNRLHERFAALGREGVQHHLLDHVKASLQADRTVYVVFGKERTAVVLDWLRQDSELVVEETGKTDIWRVRSSARMIHEPTAS